MHILSYDIDSFYLGKKVAFVYRAQREVRGTKIRVIWGKVTRPHGVFAPKIIKATESLINKHDRQLRCGEGTVQTQSSSQVIWGIGQSYVVSIIHLAISLM